MKQIDILEEVTLNTMHKMLFLLEETAPDGKLENDYEFMAEVEYRETRIELLFTYELAKKITQNFLGKETLPRKKDILDSLKEITNIISGNFMGIIYPEKSDKIPIPNVKKNKESKDENTYHSKTIFYEDEKPLKIKLKK